MKKQIISMILCLAMCLSLISTGVFAEEEATLTETEEENVVTEENPDEETPAIDEETEEEDPDEEALTTDEEAEEENPEEEIPVDEEPIEDEPTSKPGVWINGELLTEDRVFRCGEGLAWFENIDGQYTLMLDNAEITMANVETVYNNRYGTVRAAVYSELTESLAINLDRDSIINFAYDEENVGIFDIGIYAAGDLTITGDGSLTVQSDGTGDFCILSDKNVRITERANLVLGGADGGITAYGNFCFESDAPLEINDVMLSVFGSKAYSYDGDNTVSSVCFNGRGNVILKAGVTAMEGIEFGGSGDITIGGSKEELAFDTSTYGSVIVSGSGDLKINGAAEGISISGGDLILRGSGDVTMTCKEGPAVLLDNFEVEKDCGVLLEGTSNTITFIAAEGEKAVHNWYSGNSPVGGSKLEEYNVEGAPDQQKVVYTLKDKQGTMPDEEDTETEEEPAEETKETFAVSFNMNGHGSQIDYQTVEKGEKATKPANPTASGWTFKGWYTDANCTKAYDFDTAVTSDLTLYAKWVVYDPNVPNTGDDTQVCFYAALLLTSGMALAGVLLSGRKKKVG